MKMIHNIGAILVCNALVTPGYAGAQPHWTYEGETGPEHWGELSEDFASCRVGKNQSPIDIITERIIDAELPPLVFEYKGETTEVINNGHTIQVNVTPGSTLKIKDNDYALQQFHMHSPSEHKVNGESFPLEVHFVHTNEAGELAVVGMLFREGAEHKELMHIGKMTPREAVNSAPMVVELEDVFTETRIKVESYYRYSGSLTTPPCTEGVRWYAYPVIGTVSAKQIAEYQKLIGRDARGPQPINARLVLHADD
jgi:carbonic anhydrase